MLIEYLGEPLHPPIGDYAQFRIRPAAIREAQNMKLKCTRRSSRTQDNLLFSAEKTLIPYHAESARSIVSVRQQRLLIPILNGPVRRIRSSRAEILLDPRNDGRMLAGDVALFA